MHLKPNATVYLRRNNLFVAGKHVSPAKLLIPTELVTNLEVVDREKLISTCADFFSTREMKGKRVLVVLDQTVVFTKTIELTEMDKDSLQTAIDSYIAAIPFEPGQRSCERHQTDSQLELYATNYELYQAVLEALYRSGVGKVIAVTPSAAYKLGSDIAPAQRLAHFMNDKEVRQTADFSTAAPL